MKIRKWFQGELFDLPTGSGIELPVSCTVVELRKFVQLSGIAGGALLLPAVAARLLKISAVSMGSMVKRHEIENFSCFGREWVSARAVVERMAAAGDRVNGLCGVKGGMGAADSAPRALKARGKAKRAKRPPAPTSAPQGAREGVGVA